MRNNDNGNKEISSAYSGKDKILLLLMPFWTPQIPPVGISCLKSYLQAHGFQVRIADLNVVDELRALYDKYFDALREFVSLGKLGNFYNIGHDVLQNHLMAYLNYDDERDFNRLVKILVFKTYFCDITDQQVEELNGVVAEIYDWLEDYFLDLLELEKPAVLGMSVYRGNVPTALFCFKKTKERYPHIQTVMGGGIFAQALVRGTPDFEYFLEKTKNYIDKIIIGEGELLFFKMLQGELPPSQRVFTLEDIAGETLDLSQAELPDFSDLDIQFYPNMASYSSRSCPFQCSFCTETVYWGKYRKKRSRQIVEELNRLHKKYGSQLFLMCDSLLNPVLQELSQEFIDSGSSLYWDGYLRVDKAACDIEKVFQWRRGGLYRARLGVESGSQKILDAMNKKVSLTQIKNTISNLALAGIKTTTYWIIGYPGETEEDFQQTLDLIEELKDDIYEAECNPFGYYLDGQVNSAYWAEHYKNVPLYPEEARDMLLLRTWIIAGEPGREETYSRINRFVEHCTRLNIANPYSLYDIYQADDRWRNLHKNAVPPLVKFKNSEEYIEECKHVKKLLMASTEIKSDIGFNF